MNRKKIVISGVNLFSGGTLSIMKDCLLCLNSSEFSKKYEIIAFVHRKSLFFDLKLDRIGLVELPNSRDSYLKRIYYEYFYFKKYSKKKEIKFWLSIHDTTPSLPKSIEQVVYCHNPAPFQKKVKFSDLLFVPRHFFFTLFYKWLYRINIKNNKYVIVQQKWLRDRFVDFYGLDRKKIIVSYPNIKKKLFVKEILDIDDKKFKFFYPTLSRSFKNIEVICEAVKLIKINSDFKVFITIDGTENAYSRYILSKYGDIDQVVFLGRITREEVFSYYQAVNCLIFPSKLETWGLPITEFKTFSKPIIIADLDYAKETVGDYEFVKFFNEDSPENLSLIMQSLINKTIIFDKTKKLNIDSPFTEGWDELFKTIFT